MQEVARQLCLENQLLFSKMVMHHLMTTPTSCCLCYGKNHGLGFIFCTICLIQWSYPLQGKQRLLYSLLDAMQSVTSQAVVVGVSCRLDADQLLEKRVRSRFSHRKLLFLPSSREDLQRVLEHILLLPTDSRLPQDYTATFNAKLLVSFPEMISSSY
ncbi:hypothetical protein RD792_015454 [Penstemon davidsonii]|uniref:Uncharacterized protein n=1 Tax=Penstemon davidsonii TaxID=160366 RepID=A0ABR0CS37_9LAMI|nr:hypothetical protein RD792_015454 [Penstemon davidsonii]